MQGMGTRQINTRSTKIPTTITTAKMNTGNNNLTVPLLSKSTPNKIEQQSFSQPVNRLNDDMKNKNPILNTNNNKPMIPIKTEININTKSPTVSVRSFGKKRVAPQAPASADVKMANIDKVENKEKLNVNDNSLNRKSNQKTMNALIYQTQQFEILSNVKENVMQGIRFSENAIELLKNKSSNSSGASVPAEPIKPDEDQLNKELSEVVIVKENNNDDTDKKPLKSSWEKYEFSDAKENDDFEFVDDKQTNRHSVGSFQTDDDFYETADESCSDVSVSETEICSKAASILNMRSTMIGPLSKETYDELEGDNDKVRTLEDTEKIQKDKFSDNISKYIQKKSLAQGMMDLALVSANTNQLRYVLDAKLNHPYFYTSLSLIITSLVLQVVVGITLLWNSRLSIERTAESKNAERSNNFSVIGIFIVTLINVFISTFGGSPFAGSSAEVVAIPADAMDPSHIP